MIKPDARFRFHNVPIIWYRFDPDNAEQKLDDFTAAIDLQASPGRQLYGICNLSSTSTQFMVEHTNLRETVVAASSHSFNRQRQMVCALSIALFGHPNAALAEIASTINAQRLSLYTTEANGALFQQLQRLIDPALFTCSEYFGSQYRSGEVVNGILHQDLQQTSFADESFDIILSAEIFEHIPDAPRAEAEVVRLLKPGGVYCFTVPINPNAQHDDIRAEVAEDGTLIHHAPPEFHGDPVRPEEGILVFRLFSHRDLEARFTGMGCEFASYRLWSRTFGILGQNAMVHVVHKPPKRDFTAQFTAPAASAGTGAPATSQTHTESVSLLASQRGDDWLAGYLANIVEHFSINGRLHQYFDQWQERGFHITLNHYYEPVPDTRTLTSDAIWETPSELPGIEMNEQAQLHLLREGFAAFSSEYNALPLENPEHPYQFYFNNPLFSGTDALVLYCMVRHFKPNLIIEIGSGMSTTVSAQAALLNGKTQVIAIEPYPNETLRRGFPGLGSLIVKPIQDVPLSEFERLKAGDFLFIDTSHVVKTKGDVNYLFLEVLPRLNKGVFVHVHDIYLPFEYPREWVMDLHRFWTEQYLFQAFLIHNSEFEVVFANSFMKAKHPDALKETFPNSPWYGGGSFWIRRKP